MTRFLKRPAALLLAALLLLLTACAKDGEGVALRVCTGGEPASLDPIYAEEAGDQTILAHLYENLMRLTVDSSGRTTVIGGMAKSVDQNEEIGRAHV